MCSNRETPAPVFTLQARMSKRRVTKMMTRAEWMQVNLCEQEGFLWWDFESGFNVFALSEGRVPSGLHTPECPGEAATHE